jgi:hypothetical protein
MSLYPRSWSRFQSADQMRESKEDMAETIREWVKRTSNPFVELETLTRMSRKDLSDLRFAVYDAKTKQTTSNDFSPPSLAAQREETTMTRSIASDVSKQWHAELDRRNAERIAQMNAQVR